MLPQVFIDAVNKSDAGIIVFSAMRNEMLRLPAFLDHYRNIGIKAFAIIDNGSSDGTYEFLQAQPDVILLQLTDSYAASNFAMNWLNDLHQRVNTGAWLLYADADELLVYDRWSGQSIEGIVAKASAAGANAILGFMLDMYPDGPLETSAVNGNDLWRAAPCFDSDYAFRLRPIKPWQKPEKILEVIGGPRVRLFSDLKREVNISWVGLTVRGQIDRLLPVTPQAAVPLLIKYWPKQMPAIVKYPLARSGHAIAYSNAHSIGSVSGVRLYQHNVVLCHFKFLSDFAKRVRVEVERGEHYRGGAEYRMYLDLIERDGHIDLRYPGTVRFENVEQLAALGLIRDIRPFLAVREPA